MASSRRIAWTEKVNYLKDIMDLKTVFWVNEGKPNFQEAASECRYSRKDMEEAAARLERFAPFIAQEYPETKAMQGLIESELTQIDAMQAYLEAYYGSEIKGDLYLKRDDTLPIAGTIKARGAIYEVLKHAENLALQAGILSSTEDDYRQFASEEFRKFFSGYQVLVGTTGNLGISVGVMSAKLGFDVTVHMSVEAKAWKKEFLRSKGVRVVEHDTNFTEAVRQGRLEAEKDERAYFVDDEHSVDLFMGYTVAALRLQKQLEAAGIQVDEDHPLFVYSPCGIGGSPGGTAFGLKQVYGDNVHCFFAQPTHMPSMLVGQITQEFDQVSIFDFGIDGKTNLDGLAVPRTSGFVAELMSNFFDGGYSLQEEEANHLLSKMIDLHSIPLEPAALAGLPGPARLFTTQEGQEYLESKGLKEKMNQATHIAWATGGSMVPAAEMAEFYLAGKI